MDSDIPPPLDDKIRDSDFDLEEEINEDNLANNCSELPELPTDFNVFSSAATDEDILYSHPPPELTNIVISSSPPPDVNNSECDKKDRDVAKEKESSSVVVSQVLVDQMLSDDNDSEKSSHVKKEDTTDDSQTSFECIEDDTGAEVAKVLRKNSIEIVKNDENAILVDKAESVEVRLTDLTDDGEDFDDFVSGVETEVKIDIVNDLECNKSVDFAVLKNIPELRIEDVDDDDDFNDFESEKPTFNHQMTVEEPQVVQFEADFSAFNAFNDAEEDGSAFNDFQESTPIAPKPDSQLQTLEDDDDFGDFSDFTQASAVIQSPQLVVEKPADVNGILDMMFPTSQTNPDSIEVVSSDFKKEDQVIKSDNFVNKFNDFDSTLALGYLYNNSKSSQTLVKALGIDTRNIVS